MEADKITRFYDPSRGSVLYPEPGELDTHTMNQAHDRRDATLFGTPDCWKWYDRSGRSRETFPRMELPKLREIMENRLGRAGLTIMVRGYRS